MTHLVMRLLSFSYHLEKKWSQNGSTPGAVSWYVTSPKKVLNMIIKEKRAPPPKWYRFPKPWSRFGSAFFSMSRVDCSKPDNQNVPSPYNYGKKRTNKK